MVQYISCFLHFHPTFIVPNALCVLSFCLQYIWRFPWGDLIFLCNRSSLALGLYRLFTLWGSCLLSVLFKPPALPPDEASWREWWQPPPPPQGCFAVKMETNCLKSGEAMVLMWTCYRSSHIVNNFRSEIYMFIWLQNHT